MIRAGHILTAQKVEHYEIATYGTLRVFAANMGSTYVEQLLSQTLENEKATDVAMTQIAETSSEFICGRGITLDQDYKSPGAGLGF